MIDPSPIPRYDLARLHQSKALVLFGAGREKKIYAVPPYTRADPLAFEDIPFRTENFDDERGQRRCCSRCGSQTSFLDEIPDAAHGKTWQCSDTDYCNSILDMRA